MPPSESNDDSFDEFFHRVEPRLRQALTSTLGFDAGRDAAAKALAYGWEHWPRISRMDNPAGYLYVRARNRSRRKAQRHVALLPVDRERTPWVEPELPAAVAALPDQQRVVVMLLHCYEWTMSEVAELLGVSKSTVQSHAERGMARLRNHLGVAYEH